jgi:hypothetical protein
MQAPSVDFRVRLAQQPYETEAQVEEALDVVLGQLAEQGDASATDDPYEELAAIEGWASLASYAVSRFYGPQSPLRRDIAGWSKGAAEKLRRIAAQLQPRLARVAGLLHAVSFSISVGFPWGVSIGVGF